MHLTEVNSSLTNYNRQCWLSLSQKKPILRKSFFLTYCYNFTRKALGPYSFWDFGLSLCTCSPINFLSTVSTLYLSLLIIQNSKSLNEPGLQSHHLGTLLILVIFLFGFTYSLLCCTIKWPDLVHNHITPSSILSELEVQAQYYCQLKWQFGHGLSEV